MSAPGGLSSEGYDDLPIMLLFGDDPDLLQEVDAAARAAGARVGNAIPLAGAIDRLADQAAVDLVLVDLSDDQGPAIETLLDEIDRAAALGRYQSIVMHPPSLIDLVSARAGHPSITMLCDSNAIELAAAIGLALAGRRPRLHDIGSDGGTVRLRQLSEEVGRIARTLASLSGAEAARADVGPSVVLERRQSFTTSPSAGGEAAMVRSIIRARRMRDHYFQQDHFADPAWDMLLDLMAARLEARPVAVSSLCIAAAVPPTTALRWIKTMTEAGLFRRNADPRDGRRVFIELSDSAAEAMTAYLAAVRRIGGIAI